MLNYQTKEQKAFNSPNMVFSMSSSQLTLHAFLYILQSLPNVLGTLIK